MKLQVRPFLMFVGTAEAAMNFYVSLFDDAKIISIEKYGAGAMGAEGSVKKATFALAGQEFLCIDSPVKHDFTFTPSISLFVDFDDETRLNDVFSKLADGGKILMPLAEYPFARKFAWLADKFGVSWQLSLPHAASGEA
jgi:predicted 3-demethylubiquinone-9 3-methyltransferase (glyoxalase superfamily)